MDALREFLHEFVINAEIRQCAAERAARRAQSSTKNRIEEKNADEQTPKTARKCTRCRCVNDLVQLDLAIGRFGGDDRVPEFDQIFLLQFKQTFANLFGLLLRRIDNDDEI